jgi:hypothetical protein
MKLMQGYEKQTGVIGLDKPKGWSLEAVTFLSDTTSASSVQELARVGLSAHHCIQKLIAAAWTIRKRDMGEMDAGRTLPRDKTIT